MPMSPFFREISGGLPCTWIVFYLPLRQKKQETPEKSTHIIVHVNREKHKYNGLKITIKTFFYIAVSKNYLW